MTKYWIWLPLIALIALGMACGDDDDSTDGGTTTSAATATDGGSTSEPGGDGATLRVVAPQEPSNLNWYEAALEEFEITFGGIYEPLVGRDPETLEPEARLATEWEEVSTTEWSFTLREGVTFHDGSEFTSEDVVETVNHAVESESLILGYVPLASAVADGDYGVTITLSTFSPNFLLLNNWMYILPSEVANEPARLADEAIGTGPYSLAEWNRGQNMVLEANPDYWGDAPDIGTVDITYREEASVRLAALQGGDAEFVFNLGPEQVGDAPNIGTVPSQELWVLYPNSSAGDNPIFANADLRHALVQAIDRSALVDGLFSGEGEVFKGNQPGLDYYFGYNDDLEDVEFDPEAAAAAVEAAGASDTEVHYVGTSGRWTKDQELAEALTAMLEDAGFNVRLEIPDLDTYVQYILQNDDETRAIVSDLITVAAGAGYLGVERIVDTYLASTGAVSVVNDPELDSMIEAAKAETDIEAREQAYRDIIKYSSDNAYAVWLFAPDIVYGMADGVSWPAPADTRVYPQEITLD